MKDNAKSRSDFEIIINVKVPRPQTGLQQQDYRVRQPMILRKLSKNQKADTRENKELDNPKNRKGCEVLKHRDDDLNHRSEGLCELQHHKHLKPEACRDDSYQKVDFEYRVI